MKTITILFVLMLLPGVHFGQAHMLLKNIGSGSENGIPGQNQATNWHGKSYFIRSPHRE